MNMKIRVSEFGISPEHDITEKLTKLFAYTKGIDGEKTVIFEKGTYYIDSEKCEKHMIYVGICNYI